MFYNFLLSGESSAASFPTLAGSWQMEYVIRTKFCYRPLRDGLRLNFYIYTTG